MSEIQNKRPELLLPAKDLETLRLAVNFGADAVYVGGKDLGLRAAATNFTTDELREAVSFVHEMDKKLYLTVNIIPKDSDLEKAEEIFEDIKDIGIDAFLVADPGMFRVLKRVIPDANVHISTQAGNSNSETFVFWYEQGIRRVVCERLMTLEEIKKVREKIPADMEIEAFVHGAMCISYSGRCLLSAVLTGRDANHGECTHPCRWEYALVEKQRKEEFFPVSEDEFGTYIMNSRDLCMIDALDDLILAGIDSLKIEGRMKSPLYVATIARTYKRALDDYYSDPNVYDMRRRDYFEEISKTTHRPYGHGFYYGDEGKDAIIYDNSNYLTEYTYLGYVEEILDEGYIRLHQKNKFSLGDEICIMSQNGDITARVLDIRTPEGESRQDAPHPKEELLVKLSAIPSVYDVLRGVA